MIGSSFFSKSRSAVAFAVTSIGSVLSTSANAQIHGPTDGQLGFVEAATPIMESIIVFHDNLLMWIITAVVVLVLGLMLFISWRFNARANPIPSKNSHNTMIEVVWTVAPILILVVIAVPSFGVLADQKTLPDGERKYLGADIYSFGSVEIPAVEVTIKATGVQWAWEYEYADEGLSFSAFMLNEEERAALKPNQPRLLATDFDLVVPVDTTVRVQVTALDVLHAFAVPAFGIKVDAVPGRLNETWFHATKMGMFYGQCSELCGKDHSFMPIAVRVVSKEDYAAWVAASQEGGVQAGADLLGMAS